MREEFKQWLELKDMNLTPYKNIKHFIEYCLKNNIEYDNITYENLQEFFAGIKQRGLKKTSYNVYVFALRNFYKFLIEKNKVKPEMLDMVKKIRQSTPDKVIKHYVTKEELADIIEMGETFTTYIDPVKMRAILYFLFYTGLRRNEFANLKREDINLEKRTVIVRIPTKNRLERVVFLPKKITATKGRKSFDLIKLLKEYFSIEAENTNAFNMDGVGLQSLCRSLRDYAPKKKFNPHCLRHSAARMWARAGVDSRIAQKLLGHKDIASTMIYYDPDVDTVQSIYNEKVK